MTLGIIEEAGLTDVGRQRTTNEDAFLESSPVFAVADGMGGARAGEVASRIAVETLADGKAADGRPEAQLAEMARVANRKIYELAQEDESRSGMGTTLTAVVVSDGELAIGHVGDSRLYRLRDDELERLTRDHSLVEELVRRGELDPDAVDSHPQRSIITRALGPEPEVDVETFTCPAREGDVYLLCSDGLTSMVSEERVAEVLRAAPSLERAARELVEAANDNGGRDNVTVVLFRVGREDGQVADADTLSGQETRVGGVSAAEVRGAADARDRRAARARRPTARRRLRARTWVTAALVSLAVAGLAVGFYLGSRQFYFVGANDLGLVTLYRGLPYDLPAGIRLYEEEYTTSVPAVSIDNGQGRRDEILDHQLRERGDAADLVRQLEQGRLEGS